VLSAYGYLSTSKPGRPQGVCYLAFGTLHEAAYSRINKEWVFIDLTVFGLRWTEVYVRPTNLPITYLVEAWGIEPQSAKPSL
jgi:hypothetical protein